MTFAMWMSVQFSVWLVSLSASPVFPLSQPLVWEVLSLVWTVGKLCEIKLERHRQTQFKTCGKRALKTKWIWLIWPQKERLKKFWISEFLHSREDCLQSPGQANNLGLFQRRGWLPGGVWGGAMVGGGLWQLSASPLQSQRCCHIPQSTTKALYIVCALLVIQACPLGIHTRIHTYTGQSAASNY